LFADFHALTLGTVNRFCSSHEFEPALANFSPKLAEV
jgi:hypothetical protein